MANNMYKSKIGKENINVIGANFREIDSIGNAEELLSNDRKVIETKEKIEFEEKIVVNGKEMYYDAIKFPIFNNKNEVTAVVVVATEITDIKKEREKRELNLKVFDNVKEGVIITDENGIILNINKAFVDITGYSREEAVGNSPKLMKSDKHTESFFKEMWLRIKNRGEWKGEIWNRKKNGEIYPIWMSISTVTNSKGEFLNFVGIFDDLTIMKKSEDSIQKLSSYDILTGLPNQFLFKDRLEQAIIKSRKHREMFTILQIDIDNFKLINDTFGYSIGDELIKKAVERMKKRIRELDTFARISGDEFIIIVQELNKIEDAAMMAQNIINDFKSPFEISEKEIYVTVSIGITVYPEDGEELEGLMKNSNAALRYAKNQGRSNYQFYSQELNRESFERLEMESALRHALEKEEFILYYQPQIRIEDNKVVGMEALVRWKHPDLGMVSPAKFIPVAEETGIIIALGEWVLYTACMQNKIWQEQGLPKINMSVNLSPMQMKRGTIVNEIKKILDTTELCSEYLELEITEGVLMEDKNDSLKKLKEIKDLGIKIAIDDFGTGYSSLGYLKKFPMDKLKIDQCFVRDIPDSDNGAIAKVVIDLGKSVNMKVIAEGVETIEQLEFMKKNGCDEIQGYYFSRPLPPNEMEEILLNGIKK